MISDQVNIRFAWEKVKNYLVSGDYWYSESDFARFELELDANLKNISTSFLKSKYKLTPLKPIAFPKASETVNKENLRQVFYVAIKDQVAWVAFVNIIGPYLDSKMPVWSYGNRLFRSIWIEEIEEGKKLKRIGRYRNSSGKLYLPFQQSWPIYKRHILLSIKAMTNSDNYDYLDEKTKEELEINLELKNYQRCQFILKEYWKSKPQQPQSVKQLYWCSIDFRKFYPSIKVNAIKDTIVSSLPSEWKKDAQTLLGCLLDFKLDNSCCDSEYLQIINIRHDAKTYKHIPTGLFVSGFLANVAMLKIDNKINIMLGENNIAHFRFVDDHVILSYSFDDLVEWIKNYSRIIEESNIGIEINFEKVEPKKFSCYIKNYIIKHSKRYPENKKTDAIESTKLDPNFPAPLLTKTIELISTIANINFNLLDKSELSALSTQVEHLLLVDLAEDEIPEKTRLSFAANKISQLAQSRITTKTASIDEYIVYEDLRNKCEKISSSISILRNNIGLGMVTIHNIDEEKKLKELEEDKKNIENKIKIHKKKIDKINDEIKVELKNSFSYIIRAIEERPDRTRLWLRAVSYCRIAGIENIKELLCLLDKNKEKRRLSSEYLFSILLEEISTNINNCVDILCKGNSSYIKIESAKFFLSSMKVLTDLTLVEHWYSKESWKNFCVKYYLAIEIIEYFFDFKKQVHDININNKVYNDGKEIYSNICNSVDKQCYLWELVRYWINEESKIFNSFLLRFQKNFDIESNSPIWRYFPSIVPYEVLINFSISDLKRKKIHSNLEGWWFDSLHYSDSDTKQKIREHIPRKYMRFIEENDKSRISLIEWCKAICCEETLPSDPQNSEWTALEITKQIADLVSAQPSFSIKNIRESINGPLMVHPMNFTLPRSILAINNPTWESWKEAVKNAVGIVEKKYQIYDYRYSPITAERGEFFDTINNSRGLGLILLGLIRKSFIFPPIWNGFGQSDILISVNSMLRRSLNYSSWTLGILEGCLSTRAIENLYLKNRKKFKNIELDDDQINDPLTIVNVNQFSQYIRIAEKVLEDNQISTYKGKARQITPVSIKQLTLPEWNNDYRSE